jgi:hypothetical protein
MTGGVWDEGAPPLRGPTTILPFEPPAAFRALVGDWARRTLQSVAGTGR